MPSAAPPEWHATPPFHKSASNPHPREADKTIIELTTRLMADGKSEKRHLEHYDLGPSATGILSVLAEWLEDKWKYGIEGADFAAVDEAVQQRINELKKHHKVKRLIFIPMF